MACTIVNFSILFVLYRSITTEYFFACENYDFSKEKLALNGILFSYRCSNGIAGSAICAFNMSAVLASFHGPFKYQENAGAAWEKRRVAHHNRQHCGSPSSSSSHHIVDSYRYQLMDKAVQSTTLEPLHTAILERFTHIAMDITPTKLHPSVTVLYVATTTGLIKKISVLPKTQKACIVEVWGPLPSSPMTLQFLKDTQSIYVGMETGVLR